MKKYILLIILVLTTVSYSKIIQVGKGSYTTKPPSFINGTYDPVTPSASRPMNVFGPSFASNIIGKKWKMTYPAVTDRFRASGKKITTNQFWSSILFKFLGGNYSNTMHPGPLVLECSAKGLSLNNQRTIYVNNTIPAGEYTTANMIVDRSPLTTLQVGIDGIDADSTLVDDYGDWHVKAAWKKDSILMTATFGRGMPFVYFDEVKNKARISSPNPDTRFSTWYNKNNILGIKNESTKEYWLLFVPAGTELTYFDRQQGQLDTFFFKSCVIDLKNKNYFSIAGVFDYDAHEENIQIYTKYAFSFITDTKVNWSFDETSGNVKTEFHFTVNPKEGTEKNTLIAMFPHHYNNLDKSYTYAKPTYPSIRGWLKTIEGNSFTTIIKCPGFLYHFPNVIDTTKKDTLKKYLYELNKLKLIELIPDFNTSYGHGKSFMRTLMAIQSANSINEKTLADNWRSRAKTIFENWMTATNDEVDNAKPSGLKKIVNEFGRDTLVPDTTSIGNYLLFFYNNDWHSIYGLPAGFNTDTEFNDHHFTWGYFVRALVELMDKEGAIYGKDSLWGGMVKVLIRDIIGDYRKKSDGGISDNGDTLFPRFRNWDPYIGYGLASGHGDFGDGNNQESTSEAMNFNASVALFGAMTEDKYYRDLGLYLYATQLCTIENYWFDVYKRNFWRTPREWNKVLGKYVKEQDSAAYKWPFTGICRDSKSEMANFFKPAIEVIFGIQLLPYSPSSVYLARYPSFATDFNNNAFQKLRKLDNGKPRDIWQNIIWQFHALYNAQFALDEFDNFKNFTSDSIINQEEVAKGNYGENGTTRSFTYYWLQTFNSLGILDTTITTHSTQFYSVFVNQTKNIRSYIVYNPTSKKINVKFSDGQTFDVDAHTTAMSQKKASIINVDKEKNVLLKSYYEEIDFDTLYVGEDRKMMYQYYNDTDLPQEIDDIEIPDTTDQGFYLNYLDESKIVLPGHSYVGIVGFNPQKTGLALDTIFLVIDTASTIGLYEVYLKGYAKGQSDIENIETENKILRLTLSPNPANNYFDLSINDKLISQGTKIEIFDLKGNKVLSDEVTNDKYKITVPLNQFSDGTYIIRVIHEGKVFSSKLIIVK